MGLNLIEHKSAPVSDVFDFTGLTLTGYQRLLLLLDGLVVGTDDADILLQLYIAGVLETSGYRYRLDSKSSSGTTGAPASQAASSFPLVSTAASFGVGNAAGENYCGRVDIGNVEVALYKTLIANSVHMSPSGAGLWNAGGGILEETGNITGVKVSVSTGTLASGKASLYGLTVV